MVGNVVSVHGAVISSVTDFDSPAILLNDTPYLKKIKSILDLFHFFVDVNRLYFTRFESRNGNVQFSCYELLKFSW